MARTDTSQACSECSVCTKSNGAARPSGQLGDQDGIDLASLRERHHLLALDTVSLGTGGFLLVDADELEAATLGKGTQIAFLPIPRLTGSGDTVLEGRTPSHFNPIGRRFLKPR